MREVRFHTGPITSGISILVFVFKVTSGVLSVLPGPGATTGKELVSHPLIRKVDITVAYIVFVVWSDHDFNCPLRQVLRQGAH
jgi:hypothetical protein